MIALILLATLFRQYDDPTTQFYLENHQNQTLQFVLEKKNHYLPLRKTQMSIWDAIETLDSIIDSSDPDINLPQSHHAYQTAEALRRDGHPPWLILTGFIHDLGKILTTWNEPQWAVVGDTFPVGCAFQKSIIFHNFFSHNPDWNHPLYSQKLGIYQEKCGLDMVHMSWGHDEYLYHVVKPYLPKQAAYIIRYHSFYPAHKENDYRYLMNEEDQELMPWVKLFNQYDLYSKSENEVDVEKLKPYYQELINQFFPKTIQW
ncbi:MAG: hypothetical protein S4CHLAM81_12790 [Chlamydiales bacterium]|nr:hypothetical protein [Chlamydiales bacterium]MCH9636054.1 hypothetical protein [Chlamydiales bacterium]MCH9703997.1 inositol oxygenase [Chlamydiota bacterium]